MCIKEVLVEFVFEEIFFFIERRLMRNWVGFDGVVCELDS